MNTIICGFSGIGKTRAMLRNRDVMKKQRILDLESSGYSDFYMYNNKVSKNTDFPKNYIDKLEKLIENNEADYYLLSCHKEVRDELKARNLKYIIVMPYIECKNEYMKRWLKQGSDIDFITEMNKHWKGMIQSCLTDTAPKIYLDKHEYLSDILI